MTTHLFHTKPVIALCLPFCLLLFSCTLETDARFDDGGPAGWDPPSGDSDTDMDTDTDTDADSDSDVDSDTDSDSDGDADTDSDTDTDGDADSDADSSSGQRPYNGEPTSLPGRIEAEDYDLGGDGVAYFDTTDGNEGNTYRTDNVDIEELEANNRTVGWIGAGEWLEYTVEVRAADTYDITFQVASLTAGGAFHLEVDGIDVTGSLSFAATGGWHEWTQVTAEDVVLPAGKAVVRLAFESNSFNIDWFQVGQCIPKCDGRQCGSNGCGGTCGTCDPGHQCGTDGQCVEGGGDGAIPARDAAGNMANGFNVGNTFENPQHPRAPASVNAMIDAYYKEGFRTVRIPVRWIGSSWEEGDLADASGRVNRNHPRLTQLNTIIDHAIGKGMIVVVNTHHENWLFDNAWSTNQADAFERLWGDICDLFKGKPYELIFEIINEPHGTIRHNRQAVQELNRRSYNVIRGCGGNNRERNIIIAGEDWGGPNSLEATWPKVGDIPGAGKDPYVMGSIHFYNPLNLTHSAGPGGIYTNWSKGDITNAFQKVADWTEGRLPVFVGEFGINWDQHDHQINDNVRGWYTAVTSEARDRKWAFTVWDDGGWFRVMNRANQQFNGLQDACVPQ